MTQKILLTGATGFIGQHCLKRLLKTNLDIYCLSRHLKHPTPGFTWLNCDLLDPLALEKIMAELRPDYLIHTAWYVEHQKFWTSPLNIDYIFATLDLWKLFLKHQGTKAIFLGTQAELTCFHDFDNASLYARSKFITSQLVAMVQTQGPKASFVWGRVGGIFGPGENSKRFVPYVITSLLQKKIPEIKNPDAMYSWISVTTLSDAIISMLFEETPPMMDFGVENRLSLKDLCRRVSDLLAHDSSQGQDFNKNDCHHPPSSTSKSFDQEITDYISHLRNLEIG
ncbi:MAG: NAD-dependent epimerase/dehydratase family protein [Holosporales bacterium]|nr:NAD-dependent epimerase/dehydratase family protein [Holosporales bacterium]